MRKKAAFSASALPVTIYFHPRGPKAPGRARNSLPIMNLTLKVWRQNSPKETGRIETYPAANIPEEASFLEITSAHGHDAYLGHEPAFEAALTGFIDASATVRGLALNGGGV